MKDLLTEKYQQVLESNQKPEMVVDPSGTKKWYLNGMLHRLDGPALESSYKKIWYKNGLPHRLDGPAIEWMDGDKEWWVNGHRHRLDGPAVVHVTTNHVGWWINGENYTNVEFNEYIDKLKEIEKGSKEAGANLDF